jgi:ribosome maturation factor RimP
LAKWALEAPIFVEEEDRMRERDHVPQGVKRDVYAKEKALEREIAPAVERGLPGVEVLALELVSPSRICVYVDHPNGVDHALCERVTRLLDSWRSRFAIDVSSPGPERPLRKPAHFARAVGSTVALKTGNEIAGKTRFRGELVAAGDRGITIATGGGALDIPYEEIVRGNLIDKG